VSYAADDIVGDAFVERTGQVAIDRTLAVASNSPHEIACRIGRNPRAAERTLAG
jgi:hypothetical protein